MDIKQLCEFAFTDEEVQNSYKNIWGIVEDGISGINKYWVGDDFPEGMQRICDLINKLQDTMDNLVKTRLSSETIVLTSEENKTRI